jgi:23S rRNA (guanine2445-N2)-methyltransferase / 23S rRNA (guanine2069-N7)-methyltransferase
MNNAMLDLFATAPLGLETLLASELSALGAAAVKERRSGVQFQGSLELAYRICLWSRLANRILLKLAAFPAATPDALYAGVRGIDWQDHLHGEGSLAVDFVAQHSAITHRLFGAQKVKDAIVDQFTERNGRRPDVRLVQPDVRVNVYLDRDEATLSLDLSGESLHRRGYRLAGGGAPLKENLAAAVLIRAGWPHIAQTGGALFDPMCGSGTLLIEAALLAGDVAPGLRRDYFGFLGWKRHDPVLWDRLLAEAEARREMGRRRIPRIVGHDIDRDAVRSAWQNIERAGLLDHVHVERHSVGEGPPALPAGLVVVNPPYGERLGETEELNGLYRSLGAMLREHFQGWRAAVLTGHPEMAFKLGIRAHRQYALFNGTIPCKLFNFEILPERYFTPHADGAEDESGRQSRALLRRAERTEVLSEAAAMFANRLKKNLRYYQRWARQNAIFCYRVYDADLPEYAVAVDLYQGDDLRATVQEYQAPSTIDPERAEQRLAEALAATLQVLQIAPDHLHLKIRRRQKGASQYEKQADTGHFVEVLESGYRFLVNLQDYLDTGLFLDHRLTRQLIRDLAQGRHFLNLFAYTGTATVYAAKGGAHSTTSVDLSKTYLDWAARNLASNGIAGDAHRLERSDVLEWLRRAGAERRRYGLIFLDPPTFSQSKAMSGTLDVQRDHVELLRRTCELLEPGGILIFSTNARRFKLDQEALPGWSIEDISARTIPRDFARNPRIHQCWKLQRQG